MRDMKRIFGIGMIVAGAVAFAGCSGKTGDNTQAATAADSIVTAADTVAAESRPVLTTDSVWAADSLLTGGCKATARVAGRYPASGNKQLVDSIRAWLGNQLSYSLQNSGERLFTPTAAELASGEALARRCVKAMLAEAGADFKDFTAEGFEYTYEYQFGFRPTFETDSVVTYSFSSYCYFGGAHGGAFGGGQSFDANSGRRLTADSMFGAASRKKLVAMIRKALWKQYFSRNAEPGTTLSDILFEPDSLQLPAVPPVFGDKGLIFTYQQYEIAPYVYGMPACVLPYSEVGPLMRPEAKRLIPHI